MTRDALQALVKQLQETLANLNTTVAEMNGTMAGLREQLTKRDAENAELRRMLFGQRRERIKPIEREVKQATPQDADARRAKARESRKKAAQAKRELPEVEINHPVDPAKLHCDACGGEFRDLGDGETSYEYEYVPARVVRRKHIRERKVCRCGCTIIVGDAPSRVADGVMYGAGLHAHVAISKCADALPLHRQSKRLQRDGVPLAPSTLGDIFHRTAEVLRPVHDLLLAEIAASSYVNADETPMRVQASGKTRRAYLWTFIGGGHVGFTFSPSRSGETPVAVLGAHQGFLQVDAYSGYNRVCTPEGWTRVGCMAHVRRYFFAAQDTAPDDAQAAMDQILELYKVEHDAALRDIVGTDAHLALRQERSRPLLTKFHAWLVERKDFHPPKGPMGKAIAYALNGWASLLVYLEDPRLRLDNNISEQQLRIAALGRKNFLFVGNDIAGENLATLMSIVASCAAAGVNPQTYVTDVLIRIQTHPSSRKSELLPANWKNLFSTE